MKESFLHFVWQYLHFDVRDLALETGEPVQIIRQGNYQTNAGPDFENCEIRVGDLRLIGNIEIHIKSSDWDLHKHYLDSYYDNVILHVVWEHDRDVVDSKGHRLPVITLKDRVATNVLFNYDQLLLGRDDILCASHLSTLSDLKKVEWLDKAMIARLNTKADGVMKRFHQNDGDWEETAYQLLLRNFGFKVNSEAFEGLAELLPFKIVKKHIDQPHQLEALFYGQAGFLDGQEDDYVQDLLKEYRFLAHKYALPETSRTQLGWKFLRLRTPNFPTVRIAQLIALLPQFPHLFDDLVHIVPISQRYQQFKQDVSPYWQAHYKFGCSYKKKQSAKIGNESVDRLLVNTVVPLMAAYARYTGQHRYMDAATDLMEQMKPEDNYILRKWKEANVEAKTAFDSQALIMQYNAFCLPKNCLRCAVGIQLVRA